MLKSPKQKYKVRYDPDITFTTARISKNSTIQIEVRDANSDDLIFDINGGLDFFLKKRLHEADLIRKHHKQRNRIETMSFWRDEYL